MRFTEKFEAPWGHIGLKSREDDLKQQKEGRSLCQKRSQRILCPIVSKIARGGQYELRVRYRNTWSDR